jgi:hypothetical protein
MLAKVDLSVVSGGTDIVQRWSNYQGAVRYSML